MRGDMPGAFSACLWYNSPHNALQRFTSSFRSWRYLLKEDHVNQHRVLAGAFIVVTFIILILTGSILQRREWKDSQVKIGEREPLPALGYCTRDGMRPCILSFSRDAAGKMAIHIQTESAFSPAFYLKIRREEQEHVYRCEKAGGFSTSFTCRGEAMPVGETLQFLMLSTRNDTVLAEGKFPIIGLALATPEPATTPTPRRELEHPPR